MNNVTVPPNYKPTEKEPYMNPVMLEHFRRRLLQWKTEIVKEADEMLHELQHEGGLQEPDIADRDYGTPVSLGQSFDQPLCSTFIRATGTGPTRSRKRPGP